MKRDMELIRRLVLDLEKTPPGAHPVFNTEEFPQDSVNYHKYLLVEASLAEGVPTEGLGNSPPSAFLTRLTWEGHDFADAARNESVWNTTIASVRGKVGSVTFELFKQLLTATAKGQLGLL